VTDTRAVEDVQERTVQQQESKTESRRSGLGSPAKAVAGLAAAPDQANKPSRETEQGAKPAAKPQGRNGNGNGAGTAPLFDERATTDLRTRWMSVQVGFVDEPRAAVEQADALVADVLRRLTDTFVRERASLEQQWSRGDDVSTEELRVALRRYRSFFDRLLAL